MKNIVYKIVEKEQLKRLKQDYLRYTNEELKCSMKSLRYMHAIPGLNYMIWFRLATGSYYCKIKVVHKIFNKLLKNTGIKYGFDIPSNTEIGGGFLIKHFGLLIINPMCKIGENCTVVPGTIIGKSFGKVPQIGNNVTIGANSSIIGGVIVEDDSVIGAGSVVVHDIKRGSVVAGNPAKVIR